MGRVGSLWVGMEKGIVSSIMAGVAIVGYGDKRQS